MLLLRHNDPTTQETRFRALFDEHYRAIARYFRVRGYQAADAEDLVAATFEVAWRQIDAMPAGVEAVPWLFGVARNLSRNAGRKAQREAAFVNAVKATTPTSAEMPIDERAEFAETMRALAQLKPLDRDLVLLVTWDELTPTEAGRVLGLRPNSARTRLHRARRRLAALLEMDERPAPAPRTWTPVADHRDGGSNDA